MSLLYEALSELVIGLDERVVCPCSHNHHSPGKITKVIPPDNPEQYPSWLEWRVEITPEDGTDPWQKGLSGYIDPQERNSLFRLYYGDLAHPE
jgi:hypothetical protein